MTAVTVIYHRDPDGWWAESVDVPGWSAAAESFDDLRVLAEEGVKFALDDDGIFVQHQLEVSGNSAEVIFDFALGKTTVSSSGRVAIPA